MGKFNKEEFGNKLRSARLQNGLSLEYVAKKLGKSVAYAALFPFMEHTGWVQEEGIRKRQDIKESIQKEKEFIK